jgi:hypothetical protein
MIVDPILARSTRGHEEFMTMRYMLLIYDREVDWAGLSDTQRWEMYQECAAFTEGIRKSGHYRSGDQLQPIATATTVRVKNGRAGPTDRPFAETREQLGARTHSSAAC